MLKPSRSLSFHCILLLVLASAAACRPDASQGYQVWVINDFGQPLIIQLGGHSVVNEDGTAIAAETVSVRVPETSDGTLLPFVNSNPGTDESTIQVFTVECVIVGDVAVRHGLLRLTVSKSGLDLLDLDDLPTEPTADLVSARCGV